MQIKRMGWVIVASAATLLIGGLLRIAFAKFDIRERTDAIDEADRRHRDLVDAERPRAIALLNALREELRSSSIPEWAGEYSWTHVRHDRPDGVAASPLRQEGFVFGPRGDVVWWLGRGPLDPKGMVDVGHVVSVDDDRIVVDWRVHRPSPHLYDCYGSLHVLSEEIVRVRLRGGEYLVPSTRMPIFLAAGLDSRDLDTSMAPKKGGWDIETDDDLILNPTATPPIVPARWATCVRPPLVVSEAELVDGPEYFYSFNERRSQDDSMWSWLPWKRAETVHYGIIRFVYSVPLAAGQSAMVGTPMVISNRPTALTGFVVSTEIDKAQVEFRVSKYRIDRDGPLRSGEVVTNRTRRDP